VDFLAIFLDEAHILRVNCAEIMKDRTYIRTTCVRNFQHRTYILTIWVRPPMFKESRSLLFGGLKFECFFKTHYGYFIARCITLIAQVSDRCCRASSELCL